MDKYLQETRKREIPDLIKKYNKLVENVFDAVSKPLPNFKDFEKDGEVIKTAEQQMYSFIDVRNKALDNVNDILKKINELENELNDPDYYKKQEELSEKPLDKPVNTLKKYTKK